MNASTNDSRRNGLSMSVRMFFIVSLLLTSWARAQYQVYSWANFEDGALPPGHQLTGIRAEERVQVVEYSTLPGIPEALWSPLHSSEIGRFGLRLHADPKLSSLRLGLGVVLDRDKLGDHGRALYQADFYLPDLSLPLPTLAVLAMEQPPTQDAKPSAFYRFGFTKNRDMYFSCMARTSTAATIYKTDSALLAKVPRPGWHRQQIVFEGRSAIRCYIDGHETAFSPLTDDSARQLQVGIMLAEKDTSYYCFADNLSIQWTPEDAPLPDSPYAASWGGLPLASVLASGATASGGAPGAASATGAASAAGQTAGALTWLDPVNGWQRAQATRTPMLVYFYTPRVQNTLRFDALMDGDANAQAFLQRHVLARVDVNQLQGGVYARQFGVFRVPALVLLDAQGRPAAQACYNGPSDTWTDLQSRLRSGTAASGTTAQ